MMVRLGGFFFEVEVALKGVQVCVRQQLFVLKTSDNNTRGNAKFGGEALDGLSREAPLLTEGIQGLPWDEEVGGESVCLLLFAEGFLVLRAVRCFDEGVAFAVLQDVGAFVKKGEPEEILRLSA